MENAISNLQFLGWKIWGGKCYLESRIWEGGGKFRVENAISNLQFGWVEDLGWKMLARISNLGDGKFGEENAISKFLYWGGGWKIRGGKCYLESRIWGVENLGRKMLSRIFNFWGGKFGVENAISNVENLGWKMLSRISNLGFSKFLICGGGKFGAENAISNVENLGSKMLSRISNLGFGKFGVGKCYLETPIWGGGGWKIWVENAISNLEFGWWKIWGGKCYLETPIWGGGGKFG